MKRAFKIRQNDVKLNTIVIIDDIYTTGSTIDSMARVLHGAGITEVYFVALTIGRGI
ncbi:ComF family protein [Parablautia intestinalis]|uniref:ComF family protein n=1 Tax=Parablautia intestinalis TaxID=2320100 RepID=UPI00259D281F|nr:phosphoribosyltransferase family protein [Parablautia intestinalis]